MADATFISLDIDPASLRGGQGYADLLLCARRVVDAVAAADAPDDVMSTAREHLARATEELAAFATTRDVAPAGNRPDLPGEGHPAMVPTEIDHWSASEVRGRVTLTRAHDGGSGFAHGGVITLLYDDILGRLAARARTRSRTAFLHVDFRAVTRIGVELDLTARIDRIEGRKIHITGELRQAGTLLNEASALFLVMLPGQP